MIGLPPSEFWNMSPVEVYSAISGFSEFNTAGDKEEPMRRNELERLMELYPD